MESAHSKPLAVVTGASSGIGFELARVFAEEGFDLVVAAEDEELNPAGHDLAQAGVSVEAVRVDLAMPHGVSELQRRIESAGRPIEALALSAGRGAGGAFASETKLEDELEIIDLNCR